MKRKAPETLLEFSEYIIPTQWKKHRASSEDKNSSSDSNQSHPNPSQDYSGSLHLEVYDGSNDYKNSEGKEDENMDVPEDFDLTVVYDLDPVATKPANSKLPHKTLLSAIKWVLSNKKMLQRDISEALGVSPSTLSLYMNSIPRVHGWKDLERKLITWIKSLNEDAAENKDEQESEDREETTNSSISILVPARSFKNI